MKQLVIIGGGQHAVVVAEIAEKVGYEVIGFLDDNIAVGKKIEDYNLIGDVKYCESIQNAEFVIAIGNNQARKQISEKYRNLKWAILIDPSAVISRRSIIEEGTVVCANANVNTLTKVGKHCIINTASIVEHDCEIGDYCHIAPGVLIEAYAKVKELSTEKRHV